MVKNRRVIVAASLGTVFEWYDFFLYGSLAAFFSTRFFPAENETAALLASLATFGAGFGVRPLGALLFGHMGDRIGRKKTFLATITLMGVATMLVGFLPTYESAGIWASAALVTLRLMQGLAIGGEYGGAAVYVAEHAPPGKIGAQTGWINSMATGGFLVALAVVLLCRVVLGEDAFAEWGWRVPFIGSVVLLVISLYIRLRMGESPVFQAMKERGTTSRNPIVESLSTWKSARRILVAMLGVSNGATVIFYSAQFSTYYFLQTALHISAATSMALIAISASITFPACVIAGWVSDKVGRKPVILAGYGLAILFLFPAFNMIAHMGNPDLMDAQERAPVTISGPECSFKLFAEAQRSDCSQALDFFSSRGISYTRLPTNGAKAGDPVIVSIGARELTGFDKKTYLDALSNARYPDKADPEKINHVGIVLVITTLMILAGMAYGPTAAILAEMFPAKVRYTSLSVPYHFGAGWFGGFLPLVSQLIVAMTGNVYAGMWYPVVVTTIAFLVLAFLIRETRGTPLDQ
jgi:MFS family permease